MKTAAPILVTRTDRLGDVLMSLPALVALRSARPEAEIDFLVRPQLIELLTPFLREQRIAARAFDESWPATLASRSYGEAVLLFDEPGLSRALWRARVKVRVGAYSKPRSFLFLTRGKRQRRASAERNEAEYNLELAGLLVGKKELAAPAPIRFPVAETAAAEARAVLAGFGEAPRGWVIAHPGMGGSALNFSSLTYRKILEDLEREGAGRVLLSLGPAALDRELVGALRSARPDWPVLENQRLTVLGEVFRAANLVVAPSTGPLHLAHYVGTATLGIYSPVRTHRRQRWEPWGGAGKSLVWEPDVDCPGIRNCLGASCPNYFCLDVMARGGLPSRLRDALKGLSTDPRRPLRV